MPEDSHLGKRADWISSLIQTPPSEMSQLAPYLRLWCAEVCVSDQTLSRQFYLEKLGFELIFDSADSEDAVSRHVRSTGQRWLVVTPKISAGPMFQGACLALNKPDEGSEQARPIGSRTGISFLTEDIAAKYREWSERGVLFTQAPFAAPWGIHATFADLDGNLFDIIQAPWLIQLRQAERRAIEERHEARRMATYEMAMAKEVQSRLFPQRMPPMRTLSYAGHCILARQVGGDYYDFLDLGAGRLGLVVGDVAGKGFAAALLMANLQANLRSQHALALDDLATMLISVNRLFYENTPDSSYATLFFAEYDDRSRRIRFVNCGHLPPLLSRREGAIERLPATSKVLGLFADWDCTIAETRLEPGDSLVIYTDGVTEALSDRGEEFGEPRLMSLLQANNRMGPEDLLQALVNAVQSFSGREREDDITLVVAQCRG